MNLTEWARAQGVHPQTAYRWFREAEWLALLRSEGLLPPEVPPEPSEPDDASIIVAMHRLLAAGRAA